MQCYPSSKAIICQRVCLRVCLFVISSKLTNYNQLKFWGMVPLWVQIIFGFCQPFARNPKKNWSVLRCYASSFPFNSHQHGFYPLQCMTHNPTRQITARITNKIYTFQKFDIILKYHFQKSLQFWGGVATSNKYSTC